MKFYSVSMKQWVENLSNVASEFQIFAPILQNDFLDYELITPDNIEQIIYNTAKPTTPLKAFFFPVKENVVIDKKADKQRVIIGVPSCDLHAVNLLDKIFLDKDFLDIYYKKNRENTILIGTDCYKITDSCHCTSYGLNPYPEKNSDITLSIVEDIVILNVQTEKGEKFLEKIKDAEFKEGIAAEDKLKEKRDAVIQELDSKNKELPDAERTRKGIESSVDEVWKEYAEKCVSCGACAAICPTCHCFLLIDKENFEKVKNWDSCQYPAFERVAAGEDPLGKIYERLKNRYLCKFVHKPDMFGEIACTGCGRCIDACIGKIDKNEIILKICK